MAEFGFDQLSLAAVYGVESVEPDRSRTHTNIITTDTLAGLTRVTLHIPNSIGPEDQGHIRRT
jgi:hypothetical protein